MNIYDKKLIGIIKFSFRKTFIDLLKKPNTIYFPMFK